MQGQTAAMTNAGMTGEERERSIQGTDRRAHLYVVSGMIHQRINAFGLPGGESIVLVSTATTGERFAAFAERVSVP